MKRALVISGGGAKGAWGGGVAQALFETEGKTWDEFVGCSTGSLLITKIAAEEFEELKQMYTSVDMDSIFSVNPYNKKGKLSIWNAIHRLIKKKTSLGESGNLKKLLLRNFTKSDFEFLNQINKTLIVTAVNMTKGEVEYFQANQLSYESFVDMIIASTSVPIAMDLVNYNNCQYLDGGIMEHIPIEKAIKDGATEIDIIVHRPKEFKNDNWKPDNMLDVLTRTIDLLQREVSFSDATIAELTSDIKENITLNFYYTPYELCRNSLIFNKEEMLKWWGEGYEYVISKKIPKVVVTITKDNTGNLKILRKNLV